MFILIYNDTDTITLRIELDFCIDISQLLFEIIFTIESLILLQLPAVRNFQTSAVTRDIDSAAKFIGAGAATVGVAGSGNILDLLRLDASWFY